MSIQRYTNEPFGAFAKCDRGEYVLFTDHEAELRNLLSTLADIRAALGVGDGPMLSELAGIIIAMRSAHVAEIERYINKDTAIVMQFYKLTSKIERLTAERDEMEQRLDIAEHDSKKAWSALDLIAWHIHKGQAGDCGHAELPQMVYDLVCDLESVTAERDALASAGDDMQSVLLELRGVLETQDPQRVYDVFEQHYGALAELINNWIAAR